MVRQKLLLSEKAIQGQILEYINRIGIYAWRYNSGKLTREAKGKTYMITLGVAGMPDIMGICGPNFKNGKYYGRLIGIEVKSVHGRMRDVQKRMHVLLAQYGAIVFTAHSLDEVIGKVKVL